MDKNKKLEGSKLTMYIYGQLLYGREKLAKIILNRCLSQRLYFRDWGIKIDGTIQLAQLAT